MRFPLVIALVLVVVNFLVDLYIYCALHSYSRRPLWRRIHLWSSVALFAAVVLVIVLPKRGGSDASLQTVMWTLFAYLSVYIPKYIFVIFDALSRIPFLWHSKRWAWMSWAGLWVGVAVFIAMWWGALFDRYRIDVNNVTVEIATLPTGLEGLTIAQISDLHVGTFGADTTFVSKLVDRINSLHPDVIVFTGDIVNRRSEELARFMPTLSRLSAPLGVYSILGNHDYGDYSTWPSPEAKEQNMADLKDMQRRMGWTMLNNDSRWLRVNGDSLALIGVENIGDPPFPVYGSLSQAYPAIDDANIKVLLSHNPAHWDTEIADNPNSNIALTLSGHTHAMQIKVLGWSPAVFRYKKWGGMYADNQGQKLYVNIGAGEVGFPARIGAEPEITLFTLKSK